MFRRCLSAVCLLSFVLSSAYAQTFRSVHAFTGPVGGLSPNGGLVMAGDGNLYGTTYEGGLYKSGTIFRVTPTGGYTTVHNFSGPDGTKPSAGLAVGADGALYGATMGGGANSGGTLFRCATAGEFTVVYSLQPAQDGQTPWGLTLGSDGNLYGATRYGGPKNWGVVFRLTPGGVFSALAVCDAHDVGQSDRLMQASDGNLYGTSWNGGSQGRGSVFRITLSGLVTVLYSTPSSGGWSPWGPLVEGSDGDLYGVAGISGGSRIYRMTKDGVFSVVRDFTPQVEGYADPNLMVGADGALYSTAGTNYGDHYTGNVYRLTLNGDYSVLTTFGPSYSDLHFGAGAPAQDGSGSFYGVCYRGGAYDFGGIYKLSTGGVRTKLYDFSAGPEGNGLLGGLIRGADGYLYGTTVLGGSFDKGTVYRVGPDGKPVTLHSFDGTDGHSPNLPLVQAADGFLYGFTSNYNDAENSAASQYVKLFRISPAGDFTVLATLQKPYDTSVHRSPLVQGPDGMLYFTGNYFRVGTGAWSEIYKFALDGAGPFVVHSFPVNGVGQDVFGLVRARDGSLIGASGNGGENQAGLLFRVDAAGAYSEFYHFPAEARRPAGPPMVGRDGCYYGVCSVGSPPYLKASVYRLTPAGVLTKLYTFTGAEGGSPSAVLVQGEDDALYGVINPYGDGSNPGAIFRVYPQGGFAIVHSFSVPVGGRNADGWNPSEYLCVGADGDIFGTTYSGGTYGQGVLYQLSPPKRRMLLQSQTDRRIAILSLNGTTVVQSRTVTPAPLAGWVVAAYADFDRDGQSDIVMQNSTTRAVSILFMDGATVRASKSLSQPLGVGWQVMASGDFNYDGRSDLIVQNVNTQQVSVLTLTGTLITGSLPLSQSLQPSWRIVASGDFNGDGFTDSTLR